MVSKKSEPNVPTAPTAVPTDNDATPAVVASPVEASGQQIAAQKVVQEVNTGAAGEAIANKESEIREAMQQRAADVARMQAEAEERAQAEADEQAAKADVPEGVHRVPDTPVPGSGVADPRDLAPGQDLSPSPPYGVNITPQPNKAGSVYSELEKG